MSRPDELLQRLHDLGVLRPLDSEVGQCLLELDDQRPAIGLLAAAASLAVSQGHSCLPLDRLGDVLAEAAPEGLRLPALPDPASLATALQASRWAAPTGSGSELPLLYDDTRVWLGRYFHYERKVASALRALAGREPDAVEPGVLREWLRPFFDLQDGRDDWQAVAVLAGLVSPLTVITGGPGTGKTTTVLWLLAAWTAACVARGQATPRIRLAAPTGKAAARLGESLRERAARLAVPDAVRAVLPQHASTLHRLLGVRGDGSRFQHHAGHPLDADLVVVDEVSMVDLPLMAHLLEALPGHARLVLLGDRDQLASVEAGNVLAAICAAAGDGAVSTVRAALVEAATGTAVPHADAVAPFADNVVELQRSHRFGPESGLGQVASLVRQGREDDLCQGLAASAFEGVDLDIEAAGYPIATLVDRHLERFAALADCADAGAALALASTHRVLTALREGPYGSGAFNAAFEQALRRRNGIDADQAFYPGRLLLVNRNDYAVDLFNGDVGVVLPDAKGALRAWFPAAEGGIRAVAPAALPDCESAWAMTIHKSQGSEFEAVDIVLPPGETRVLGRELLYTAVTRARSRVTLVATEDALRRAVGRSTRRYSGLADMLRQP